MTTGGAGQTGGAGTGGAGGTGAAGTGAAGTGATGATGAGTGGTGSKDNRLNTFKVPSKYENEKWAKEVKSTEDMWEKMAGAQNLIGKDKIALPGDGASQEVIDKFQMEMGRPEKAEGYEFKSIEELKEVPRNVELDHEMKKIFFDTGIPKEAGERIVSKYEEVIHTLTKPTIEAAAKREMDFKTLSDEVLGEDKDSAMDAFKVVFKGALGDKAHLISKIEAMDNDVLLPMIVLSKTIHDKYTGENRVITTPGSPASLSGDLKTDFQSLSQQKLNIKTNDNIPEHVKKPQIAAINSKMAEIGIKAKIKGIDLFSQ